MKCLLEPKTESVNFSLLHVEQWIINCQCASGRHGVFSFVVQMSMHKYVYLPEY